MLNRIASLVALLLPIALLACSDPTPNEGPIVVCAGSGDLAPPSDSEPDDAGADRSQGFYFCYSYEPYPAGLPCETDQDCPDPASPCVVRTCGASGQCFGNYAPLGAALCGSGALYCSGALCCGWLDSANHS